MSSLASGCYVKMQQKFRWVRAEPRGPDAAKGPIQDGAAVWVRAGIDPAQRTQSSSKTRADPASDLAEEPWPPKTWLLPATDPAWCWRAPNARS